MDTKDMITKESWEEFRKIGLLWMVNRSLHLFGWALVFDYDDKKVLKEVYPARCKFRGFSEKDESEEFIKVTKYLKQNIDILEKETLE